MIKEIIIVALLMIIIDAMYISIIGKDYIGMIEKIQKKKIKMNSYGVFISYFFLVLGLYYFVIKDLKLKKKNNQYLIDAFMLGLVIYGVYEGTSYALIEDWYEKYLLVDTIWGGILFALVSYIYNFIYS